VNRYFLATLASHIRRSRSLYLLTVAGVALGVASVLCIQILNLNALSAFRGGVQAVSGEADFSLVGRTPTLPDSIFARVLGTPGVAGAWPLYRIDVALEDGPARANSQRGLAGAIFLEIVGVDFFAPTRFPIEGAAEETAANRGPSAIAAALSTPGWVALSPAFAQERGWAVGDSFVVSSGSRRATLQVGAMVDFQRYAPTASRKIALMDIAQAQALLGRRGEIHQIDVRVSDGQDIGELTRRLETRLGPQVQALTPQQRESQAAGLLSAFRLNLTALSLISLVVGLFLIYTSTQASLVRRRGEFGLLRALGATRGQVLGLILGEVTLLGALGVALGIPLGYFAAQANVDIVSATLSNLYLLDEIERLELPLSLYLSAAAIGIGGALLGAILPALDLGRRDVRGLLVAFTLREKISSLAPRAAAVGLSLLTLGALIYLAGGSRWKPSGFALGLFVLISLALCTPAFVQTVCRRISPRGFGLRYSLRSLEARLQTTSFAIAALGVAVSMLVAITLLVGSFRETVSTWVDVTLQADVYITTSSWARAGREATIDSSLVERCERMPEVRAVDVLRQFFAQTQDGRRIRVAGVRIGIEGGEQRFPLLAGDPEEALRRVENDGAVIVTEPLARKAGLWVGDTLKVHSTKGLIAMPIAGVSYDYSSEEGAAGMDLRFLEERFGPGPINNLALYLTPGVDVERFVDALRASLAPAPLEIRSNRLLRQEVFAIFDQTFAITRILQGMALLIAATGIALTLLVLARERIAELALYRSLGALRSQIFLTFVGEGLGIGLFGLLLGGVGGVALAALLIYGINLAYFGWTIRPAWPGGALLLQGATILAAALLASLYPAFRASNVPAGELSREDV